MIQCDLSSFIAKVICFRLHDFGFNPGSTPTLLSYSHYDGLAFRELRWDGNGWEIGNREMEAAI